MVRLITGAGGMMGSHLYDAPTRSRMSYQPYYNSTLDSRERPITQEMEMLDVLH